MIDPKLIEAAGGDWAGYGEISKQQLLELLQQDKISIVFANNSILIAVQTQAGSTGIYNLAHTQLSSILVPEPEPDPVVEPVLIDDANDATALVQAIDVSNHQPRDLSAYVGQFGVQHVVVKLYQTVEIAGGREHAMAQMASAKSLGCTVGGYVWLYSSVPIRQQVDDARSLFMQSGDILSILWIDVEPYTDGSLPTVEQVGEAITYCRSLDQRVGIYTGPWVWEKLGWPDVSVWEVPLWTAEYNDRADLSSVRLFGGWTSCAGHQYTSTPIDRNVFLSEYTR